MTTSVLDDIVRHKVEETRQKREAPSADMPLDRIRSARLMRGFQAALRQPGRTLIPEATCRSPSKSLAHRLASLRHGLLPVPGLLLAAV